MAHMFPEKAGEGRIFIMINYLRAYPDLREQTLNDEDGPIRFVASTEGVKADGQNLLVDKWILSRYEKHPVVLYAHDFLGKNLPIGTGQAAVENRTLMIDVTFDSEDEFAMRVRRKTVKGMMGGSVSWNSSKEGNELLEFSVVPIPLDPDALPVRQQRSYQDWLDWAIEITERIHERKAIPPHTTTSPRSLPGGASGRRRSGSTKRRSRAIRSSRMPASI